MSAGKVEEGAGRREVVRSEARRRNKAVRLRAGSGVVGFWVERKCASQGVVGVRDLEVRWAVIWAA